ncbi:MAG: hypothetical protein ABIO95_05930 [Bdellovibrionota bacterium]
MKTFQLLALLTMGLVTGAVHAELRGASIVHENVRYEVVVDPTGQKVDLYVWKNADALLKKVDIALSLTSESGTGPVLPLRALPFKGPLHYQANLSEPSQNFVGVALKLQFSNGHKQWLRSELKRIEKH